MLPDFLLIGAAKSATTWIARRLGQHPKLWVHPRELHFFSRHHDRGTAWYERQFRLPTEEAGEGVALFGEKSNTYLSDPAAAARIHALVPEAKLVAILREPVERAYSGYCMQLARGKASSDVRRHLDPSDGESPFLQQGLYAQHLQRFVSLFPREQLEVRLYDDLLADRQRFVAGLLRSLGADPAALPEAIPERVNARRGAVLPRALAAPLAAVERLLGSGPAGRRWLARLATSKPVAALRQALSKTVTYPPLEDDLRRDLAAFYREDVAELEAWLGRDLAAWRGEP